MGKAPTPLAVDNANPCSAPSGHGPRKLGVDSCRRLAQITLPVGEGRGRRRRIPSVRRHVIQRLLTRLQFLRGATGRFHVCRVDQVLGPQILGKLLEAVCWCVHPVVLRQIQERRAPLAGRPSLGRKPHRTMPR